MRALQKFGVFAQQRQRVCVDVIGGQRHGSHRFLHIGIDKFDTVLLCHRYPVITVEHKIDIANLVKIHGRQTDIVVKGAIDLAPATNSGILGGQEGIVEIAKPPNAADDFSTGTSCMPRRMKPRNFRLSRTTSQAMRSVFWPDTSDHI